ncbi:hypothetical protein BX666DRAFT_2021316 [Dichotomocladium elegans]|nr:hypothetical protein BX666DRAFT_2021316 [Dichotomocladium elegans]
MHVAPNEKKKVKLLESAIICHIDESCLFDNQARSTARLEAMAKQLFPDMAFVAHGMEEVFSSEFTQNGDENGLAYALNPINDDLGDYVPATREERVTLLKQLFDGISKNSSKEDLYWHIKQAMLVKVAQRENCSYIFLADTATRQAIKMISMTSKGRGYSIPLDVGAENDVSFQGVAIIRPMKDMLAKEIGLYNRFSGLDSYVIPPTDFGTRLPNKASIEKLTEHFIATLDRGFPSTVSTISRTASKLTLQQSMDMNRKCAICYM